MASVLSGPFSVRAGGAIGGGVSGGGRAIPSLPRRLNEAERRHMAVRLRRDGWSYHRIAQALDMRYSLVAAIADGAGDPAPTGPAVVPAARRTPAPPVGTQRPAPGGEEGDMTRKLDDLIAAVARQGEALARLETTLPRTIEAAHDTLFERLVQSFRGMLDRLRPRADAPPPAGTPSGPA
jgi:hypothetical protein